MWLHIVSRVLLVICIVIAVCASVALIVLRLIGGQLLAVQSNSMQPVFAAGDALIVLPAHHIQPGEIVSYHNPTGNNIMVSHRATATDESLGTITTKGDAQKQSSAVAIQTSSVVGRAVGVIPGLGRIMNVVRKPIVVVTLVYIPMGLLLAREIEKVHQHFARSSYRLANHQ